MPPIYGTLRPVSTWNPIIINFKHLWQLIKDAWNTQKFINKIKIWFMPTGWRPDDIIEKYPLKEIKNPYEQIKYKTNNSSLLIVWAWTQHIFAGILMFHFFKIMNLQSMTLNYFYAVFLLLHIFSFTALLDYSKSFLIVEFIKIFLGFGIIYYNSNMWFDLSGLYVIGMQIYFGLSFLLTINFYSSKFKQKSILT